VKKGSKLRLCRVKESQKSFAILKTFACEEIKSVETEGDIGLILNITKPYRWVFEDKPRRVEFLYVLIKSSEKYIKKLPKLMNFDEEMIFDQMEALSVSQTAAPVTNEIDDEEVEEGDEITEIGEVEIPNLDLDEILQDFHWSAGGDASALEQTLLSELNALESANVHDLISSEQRASSVIHHINSTMEELSTIENWLNHYTGLLERMGIAVHQIEAQNKGMQTTTANMKALNAELESFIQSLKVPSFILEILANEGLDTADGVKECEMAVNRVMDVIKYKNVELVEMAAVKERISVLHSHLHKFIDRLITYLEGFFGSQAEMYLNDKTRASQRGALKLHAHEVLETKMFKFRKIIFWLKEFDARKHHDLQLTYSKHISTTYAREIGDFLEILRNLMNRKSEDMDFLFTNTNNSVIKSAMVGVTEKPKKLDWRRKRRESVDEDRSSVTSEMDEKMNPDDALGHALLKLTNLMAREQNLLIDFFGLVKGTAPVVSTTTANFPTDEDDVSQWQGLLGTPRQPFKDPKSEKRIMELLDSLFEGIRDSVISVMDTGLKHDQSYAVGMMVQIEYHQREYSKTSHIFIVQFLDALLRKTTLVLEKFIAEQVKAIEDQRVTAKKRSGILPVFSTFPIFVDRVEKMLSAWDGQARKQIDKAYARIIKAMFDTLEAEIQHAKLDKSGDDKDSLNMHIMNVENMHHFHAEIRSRKVPSLETFVKQAKTLYDINLEAYCKVVIRKPLGKLLEFFEGVEGLLKTGPADEVSYHVQYSKSALKDVIKKYPGKEVKKSLESLYKRVDKHFTEEEGLLQVIWRGIQEEFCRQLRKYEELMAKCYPEITIRLDFTMVCSVDVGRAARLFF
jgi:hypothetical protein